MCNPRVAKPQDVVVWVRANHKRMQIVRLKPVPERKRTTHTHKTVVRLYLKYGRSSRKRINLYIGIIKSKLTNYLGARRKNGN